MNERNEQEQPLLVSVRAVAEALGVSQTSVYRYANEGRLPHIKIGGTIKFSPEDVAAALIAGAAAT